MPIGWPGTFSSLSIRLSWRLPIVAAALMLSLSGPLLGASASVVQHLRDKSWVTAGLNVSHQRTSIVVNSVEQQRVVRELTGTAVGYPALSHEGTRLTFTQTVVVSPGDYRSPHFTVVCVIDTDGSNYAEIYRTGGVVGDLAWSYDGTRIALIALPEGIDTSGQTAPSVLVLDVTARPARVALQWPLKRERSPAQITTQAWAPDGRRLVFSTGAGRMRVLKLQSGVEVDLGPGQEPTWSRDGTRIAFRLDTDHSFGGYWLVSPDQPSDRGSILSNSPSLTDQLALRGPFVGPAIWSPDGKYLLLSRLVGLGEFPRPYVLELATRNVEALPAGSMGEMRSWAGVP